MQALRDRARTIVFESESRTRRAFDAAVIRCSAGVDAVFVDSTPVVHRAHADVLYGLELLPTISMYGAVVTTFCWRRGSPLHPEPL